MTLAECVKEALAKDGRDYVYAGMYGLLDEAYANFGGKVSHPLNRQKACLDAVRRSSSFEHDGYIRMADCSGRKEILRPVFKLTSDTR